MKKIVSKCLPHTAWDILIAERYLSLAESGSPTEPMGRTHQKPRHVASPREKTKPGLQWAFGGGGMQTFQKQERETRHCLAAGVWGVPEG